MVLLSSLAVLTSCAATPTPDIARSSGVSASPSLARSTAAPTTNPARDTAAPTTVPLSGIIDTETHVAGTGLDASQTSSWAASTIRTMDAEDVRVALLVPAPVGDDTPQFIGTEEEPARVAVALYPDRFALLLGGDTLNPMIQQAVRAGSVAADLRARFEQKARSIATSGAKGFGEMAALHFSLMPTQSYEFAPADHPLFLLLDDIAAQYGMPINVHMEAVPADMALPHVGLPLTSLNPSRLTANIAGLERLLDHDRRAPIVWEQTGWDNTGFKNVELLRTLLTAHPNLYLSIKIRTNTPANIPIDPQGGRIVPAWRGLIDAFPDRFVLGSDTFFGNSGDAGTLSNDRNFVRQLSPETARAVAIDNAIRLYHLAR